MAAAAFVGLDAFGAVAVEDVVGVGEEVASVEEAGGDEWQERVWFEVAEGEASPARAVERMRYGFNCPSLLKPVGVERRVAEFESDADRLSLKVSDAALSPL